MLVIGSTALAQVMFSLRQPFRVPADLDVICTEAEMNDYADGNGLALKQIAEYKWQGFEHANNVTVEFEMLHQSESGRMYMSYVAETNPFTRYLFRAHGAPIKMIYAPLEVLYSIKKAHRHYPRAWKKHIQDLMLMHEHLGGYPGARPYQLVDRLPLITKIREGETELCEGKLKTPSLNKVAGEFFNDNVSNKTFVHDEIHQVMAYRTRPMFTYYKKDGEPEGSVKCSKEKFFALPIDDQCRGVLEEAYVIALERCIIPMLFAGGKISNSQDAFDWALMRICTNLCSGWFREFATMNYTRIFDIKNTSYVEKFLKAVEDGGIKQIKEPTTLFKLGDSAAFSVYQDYEKVALLALLDTNI